MADVSKFKIGTIIYNIKDAVARKVMKGAETNAAGEAGQVPAPEAGAANRYLRSDGTWQVPPDTNTTYGNMAGANTSAAGKAGLVPAPGAGAANRYLRSDGSWQVPPDTNTTYGNMTAATANAAGRAGLVPAPGAGAQGKYLRGDGTWQTPPDTNTVYTHPSTHPASMISQDASHRFVTDTEKTAWNGKVNTSDIINNCTSTATNKPLSAAQGKALWDKYTQLNGDLGKTNIGYELIRGTLTCDGAEKIIKTYTPAAGIWLIFINSQILSDSKTRAYITCYVNDDEQNVFTADIPPYQYHGNGSANVFEFNGSQPIRISGFAPSGIKMRYNIGLICLKKA